MKLKYSDGRQVFNIHTDGIPYLSFDMLDGLGVPNLFSTRYISYDEESGTGVKGLRCAVMKTETVEEASPVCRANRDILAHQLGSTLEMELVTDQKHTNYVHVADCEEDLGVATVGTFALHRQYVDGIVTDIPDALLTVFGGDCPPVYIVDPKRRAAGLVHAGWKGTLGKIPQVAIAQMTVKFGCDPADMYAAIGPGVCVDCYEMGDEVYDAFARQDTQTLSGEGCGRQRDTGREIPPRSERGEPNDASQGGDPGGPYRGLQCLHDVQCRYILHVPRTRS